MAQVALGLYPPLPPGHNGTRNFALFTYKTKLHAFRPRQAQWHTRLCFVHLQN
jgi:hypothetical protein